VLGHVRVGAGEQQAPPRRVRYGRPHLLAGDPPVPVRLVTDRPGGQAGQVGPGAGLAEQLAPHLLAGPQRPQPALLLLLGAEREDRRGRHAQADADPGGVVVRGARRGELGVHRGLQRAGQALAAEPGRVVHPGQPGVEPGPQELQPGRCGRVVPGQEVADLLAQLGSLVGPGQHSGPPAT
jgi:hypothetical protein